MRKIASLCAILIVAALSAYSQAVISWGAFQAHPYKYEGKTVTFKDVTINHDIERANTDEDEPPFYIGCAKGNTHAQFYSVGGVLVCADMAEKLIDYFAKSPDDVEVDITGYVADFPGLTRKKVPTLFVTKIVFSDGSSFKGDWK